MKKIIILPIHGMGTTDTNYAEELRANLNKKLGPTAWQQLASIPAPTTSTPPPCPPHQPNKNTTPSTPTTPNEPANGAPSRSLRRGLNLVKLKNKDLQSTHSMKATRPSHTKLIPLWTLGFCSISFHASSQDINSSMLSQQGEKDFARVFSPSASGIAKAAAEPFTVLPTTIAKDRILTWHRVALQATASDHARGPTDGYDHLGPHRSSRAMAIIHIAMYDAVNSITRKYNTYTGVGNAPPRASVNMAIAQAARDTLWKLYSHQRELIDDAYRQDTMRIAGTDQERKEGMDAGAAAAKAILDLREGDGSELPEPDIGTKDQADNDPLRYIYLEAKPGVWQPDPISQIRVALGYHWGKVTPFILKKEELPNYRPKAPPQLNTPEYAADYNEALKLGGDPDRGTLTTRKPHETFLGVLWAYDGTPGLCAPPRLYNQVATQVMEQNGSPIADMIGHMMNQNHHRTMIMNESDLIRYLTIINAAMADTAISAWDAKWHYKFWRPITAITYDGEDGNPNTMPHPSYYPLGAPATNSRGPNFTPPFPAYPSGHAAFGGALFGVLRSIWGERTSFQFVSDEFNGQNRGMGTDPVRPLRPLFYANLSQPEWENARSRIWLGIHWQFDADSGISQGNNIANTVVASEKFKAR